MSLPNSRFPVLRTAAASALATAALAAGLPGVAHAYADVSVKVVIRNNTSTTINLLKYKVIEGASVTGPTSTISVSSYDSAETQSDMKGGGTSGALNYRVSGGTAVLRWSNPSKGANKFSCTVPSQVSCSFNNDQRSNAEVTFTLTG
ncbi:hypothetical protein GCM10010112_82490 [Actinoplanes lobatus]|uniref:Acylphosphatase n=1 Tax=Actinoplanes lobatus TaxID=113568 RepID=A0A7W7HLY1_9ACTN|nr:hypothetical protein [Actinoplanes lobatus]MBB4752662.1 acylphosphatase [Actinoplanes lobatus]GGN93801.1 hypothetical protein GCM10010112_82490 [Actinoplanes lobatus]GIE44672.1 hypothetical protein Alo02nite_75700 [Actinoplanes lobatus]